MTPYNAAPMSAFLNSNLSRVGCWEWPLWKDKDGYGRTKLAGRTAIAHRVAFLLASGPIPRGRYVLHRCDNRACCNPAHLFLGTAKDNYEDARSKGRHSHGERNGYSKLTCRDVVAIRRDGRTQVAIAAAYGVRQSAIWSIKAGKAWAHV